MKVGFIINPIAGMGGKVGLKGTDGIVKEAIRRGAKPISNRRAEEFLKYVNKNFEFYTCSNLMGGKAFEKFKKFEKFEKKKFDAKIIYKVGNKTTAEDTKRASKLMAKIVDIIVFVGGDGTACDIYDAIDAKLPILGVPSGVKMYSAVFAFTPYHAAEVLNEFDGKVEEREIMDIDEEALRNGKFEVKLKGYAIVPLHEKIQASKEISYGNGKEEIAQWIVENIDNDTIYIIGGGSTTWQIKKEIGIEGSFLGIDVLKGKEIICKDASEKEIKECLKKAKKAKIIVSPLGKQGFIFGRGNQPISDEIIKKVGRENIIVVATKNKLNSIDSLKVDTGNEKINEMLRGYMEIITGYKEKKIMKVE